MVSQSRRMRWIVGGAVLAMVAALTVPIPAEWYGGGPDSSKGVAPEGMHSSQPPGPRAVSGSADELTPSKPDGEFDELDDDDDVVGPEEVADGESAPSGQERARSSPTPKPIEIREEVQPRTDTDDARSIFAPLTSDTAEGGNEGSTLSSDFFGAVRVPRGGGIAALPTTATPATPEPNPLPWVGGQARGYTMLYGMQPEARVVVERQVNALISAKLREVHVGVLMDGTFGQDISYLESVIERLSQGGRKLTLVLYLSNGPTMRRWRDSRMQFLFSNIEPVEFRRRIRSDRGLRARFSDLVVDARRIFEFSRSQNAENTNVAVVMLEDNLDTESYRAMRTLASDLTQVGVSFVRNPCVGCYRGNDGNTLGDAREEHALSAFPLLAAGDAYSLDGVGFNYPNAPSPLGISSEQVLELMRACAERGLKYVGLWRHGWQGIQGSDNPPAQERVYTGSDDDQIRFEIRLLREGLIPEQEAGGAQGGEEDDIEDGVVPVG